MRTIRRLDSITDEELVRAICNPILLNFDEVNSLRGPDIDKLDDNAFLRSLTEPIYITD